MLIGFLPCFDASPLWLQLCAMAISVGCNAASIVCLCNCKRPLSRWLLLAGWVL